MPYTEENFADIHQEAMEKLKFRSEIVRTFRQLNLFHVQRTRKSSVDRTKSGKEIELYQSPEIDTPLDIPQDDDILDEASNADDKIEVSDSSFNIPEVMFFFKEKVQDPIFIWD